VAPSRLLQRGGTIAAAATALVIGGSGIALGATTHTDSDIGRDLTTPVSQHVSVPVDALAPNPRPQLPPVTAVKPVVKPVVKTVKATVHTVVTAVTNPTDAPPPSTPGSATPKAGKPAHHVAARAQTTQRAVTRSVSRLPVREVESRIDAQDAAFVQRTEPAVTPSLTGPLAELPGYARHAIPTALIVVAAAILTALAAGHVGLWQSRRTARI
jgi:hypothetical protein